MTSGINLPSYSLYKLPVAFSHRPATPQRRKESEALSLRATPRFLGSSTNASRTPSPSSSSKPADSLTVGLGSYLVQCLTHSYEAAINIWNNRSAVESAIMNNNTQKLQELSATPGSLNRLDFNGKALLHHAIEYNRPETVRTLLAQGANPDLATTKGLFPLHLAVEVGNTEILTALLRYKALKNKGPLTGEKMSPIHLAIAKGDSLALDILLKAGSNPNRRNVLGNTPLHEAVQLNQVESVERLLDPQNPLRTLLNIPNTAKATPLHLSAENHNLGILLKLLDKGADPKRVNVQGKAALHILTDQADDLDDVTLQRLAAPEYIKLVDAEGRTAAHKAAEQEKQGLVGKLLNWGASPHAKTPEGETVLHILSQKVDHLDETLLKQLKSVLNSTNQEGQTAVYQAIERKKIRLLRQLLAAGADAGIPTHQGVAPIHLAIESDDSEILPLLLAQDSLDKSPVTQNLLSPIHRAVSRNKPDALALLLKAGSDPNLQDARKSSALHYATHLNQPELIKSLLADPRILVNLQNQSLGTPLHVSAAHPNLDSIRSLLNKGADPKLKNARQETALHILARHADDIDAELLQRLAPTKALLDAADINGRTVLHDATEGKKKSLLGKLLDLGADPNAKTEQGLSPLHIAALQDEDDNRDSDQMLLQLVKAQGSLTEPVTLSPQHQNVDVRHILCENGRRNLIDVLIPHSIHKEDAFFLDRTKQIHKEYQKRELNLFKTQEKQKQLDAKKQVELEIIQATEQSQLRIAKYRKALEESRKEQGSPDAQKPQDKPQQSKLNHSVDEMFGSLTSSLTPEMAKNVKGKTVENSDPNKPSLIPGAWLESSADNPSVITGSSKKTPHREEAKSTDISDKTIDYGLVAEASRHWTGSDRSIKVISHSPEDIQAMIQTNQRNAGTISYGAEDIQAMIRANQRH